VSTSEVLDPEAERWRRTYPTFPGVAKCVSLLGSRNVRGAWVDIICHELAQHAAETLDDLVGEFHSRKNDARVRALIMTAIGEAAPPNAVPFLSECLDDPDESVRGAAVYGLKRVGTKEARTALWRASAG
jgi:HEAT repeat protein